MRFQNRVLRRICGPKREEVARGRRKLQNEESQNLYVSSNIIRTTESRIRIWTGHVALERNEKCIQNFGRKF
jgi:hypothetical protein